MGPEVKKLPLEDHNVVTCTRLKEVYSIGCLGTTKQPNIRSAGGWVCSWSTKEPVPNPSKPHGAAFRSTQVVSPATKRQGLEPRGPQVLIETKPRLAPALSEAQAPMPQAEGLGRMWALLHAASVASWGKTAASEEPMPPAWKPWVTNLSLGRSMDIISSSL